MQRLRGSRTLAQSNGGILVFTHILVAGGCTDAPRRPRRGGARTARATVSLAVFGACVAAALTTEALAAGRAGSVSWYQCRLPHKAKAQRKPSEL